MPDNAPEKLFNNLPTQVPFPLNKKDRLPHGLIWFADKGGNLPDAGTIWRDTLEALEEELAFADDSKNTRKILSEHELFGTPYRYIVEEDDEEGKGEEILSVDIALGKKASSDNLLYALTMEKKGFLAVGRTMPYTLPHLIEDTALFYRAMPEFPVHPSRIASGKDGFCMEDYEPSEEKSLLGPWNFAALRSNSLKNLNSKAAATLARIPTPDRLWAVYLRFDDSTLDAAAFSLVEADGEILDAPFMLFETFADIGFSTGETGSLLRLLFFWQ